MAFIKHVFPAMGGINELHIHANNALVAEQAAQACVREAQRIEAKYSRYRPDSALSKINARAGHGLTEIDQETAALLAYADTCYVASQGLFDISSGILRKAWDFKASEQQARVPSHAQLQPLLECVGWQRVTWQPDGISFPAGMELDFGGIGKEYATDRLAALLAELGIQHAMVNMAGDIRAIGPQAAPDCEWQGQIASATVPWRLGISHPRQPGRACHSLSLEQGALATSGDYERFLEIDGQRYCHILNPQTGMPVNCWQSVSVLAPLCVAAGSACTIAMLFGVDALDFLAAQNVDYLVLGEEKSHSQGVFSGGIS